MTATRMSRNGRHQPVSESLKYPATNSEWREMAVEISDDELLIGGWQVMQGWEKPLMEVMAREVALSHGDVLEIGYGMGMAARMILDRGCTSYTAIEAHPTVAKMARAWARMQNVPCTILEGMWQDIAPRLSAQFDGVLFDTFPLSAEERGRNHFPFIPIAPSLLRSGGKFVCYSDETVKFRGEHLAMLLANFNEVKLVKVTGLEPGDDCEYWREGHMIVPVAQHT